MSNSADRHETEMRRQSYWRLIKYARPYWKRLMLGIIAGLLVGGSLFVSISMIPNLIGVVDTGNGQITESQAEINRQAQEDRKSVV